MRSPVIVGTILTILLIAPRARGGDNALEAFLEPMSLPALDDGHDTSDAAPAFSRGSWNASITGGYQPDIGPTDAQFAHATASAGYFFRDDWSINAEVVYYSAHQPGHDPAGGGFNAILRWHFFRADRFTAFIDGGGGLAYFEHKYPAGGTHFNYTAHAGAGITLQLLDNLHLIAGARYFHASNAQIHGRDENPSFDGVGPYVGLMLTF